MMQALIAFAEEVEGGSESPVPFPPPRNLVEWAPIFGEGSTFEFNKIALIAVIAFALPTLIFLFARGGSADNPSKMRIFAEGIVNFVEEKIAKPGIGHGYEPYVPLLTTFFLFIVIGNLFEVIPFFQMPLNARMAAPLILALTAWAMFIAVGLKHHGFKYVKDVIWPPSVENPFMRGFVGFIELFSTFIARPLSHAVRLFANMLAGHILLVTFGVLTIGTFAAIGLSFSGGISAVAWVGSLAGLIAFTGFEVGVSFIQGFVFAILAAVYIGSSLHPAH